MRFFKTFLATLAAMAFANAIAAAIVNPRRELIGHRFPALQPNSRAAKLALLDSFSRGHPVDALVLGSSRSMHLPPELLSRLTGRRFFNLAVFSGRPEDFLALYRAVIARGVPIRSVVIGVDPDALDPVHPPELELKNNPRLTQALNGKPFDVADWMTFAGGAGGFGTKLPSVTSYRNSVLPTRLSTWPGEIAVNWFTTARVSMFSSRCIVPLCTKAWVSRRQGSRTTASGTKAP